MACDNCPVGRLSLPAEGGTGMEVWAGNSSQDWVGVQGQPLRQALREPLMWRRRKRGMKRHFWINLGEGLIESSAQAHVLYLLVSRIICQSPQILQTSSVCPDQTCQMEPSTCHGS